MGLAKSQLIVPLVTLGVWGVLGTLALIEMRTASRSSYALVVPGLYVVDWAFTLLVPLLIAVVEWPFYCAAGVQRGALRWPCRSISSWESGSMGLKRGQDFPTQVCFQCN
jgi:hypothetical protein